MSGIKYDNDGDRFQHGFDAGVFRDGIVTLDPQNGHFVLVDEDDVGFDPQKALESLQGKRVRITLISFDALQTLGELTEAAQKNKAS